MPLLSRLARYLLALGVEQGQTGAVCSTSQGGETVMRLGLMIVVTLAAMGGAICTVCPAVSRAQIPQAANTPEVEPVIATLIVLHNQERSQAGLPALTMEPGLIRAAQIQAQYMARYKKATHQ